MRIDGVNMGAKYNAMVYDFVMDRKQIDIIKPTKGNVIEMGKSLRDAVYRLGCEELVDVHTAHGKIYIERIG